MWMEGRRSRCAYYGRARSTTETFPYERAISLPALLLPTPAKLNAQVVRIMAAGAAYDLRYFVVVVLQRD